MVVRFAVAFKRFQRLHRTPWRDYMYLLDNKSSSFPGKGLELPCFYRSEDDQANDKGLL